MPDDTPCHKPAAYPEAPPPVAYGERIRLGYLAGLREESEMTEQPANVTWHPAAVMRPRGCVVWFTGLSGSGKSTIANAVDVQLHASGIPSFLLDGDNIRHALNAGPELLEGTYGRDFARRFGLAFGADDRAENIRRIAAVAELFCAAGMITLTAFVSPYRRDRKLARQAVCRNGSPRDFVEVFVDTPLPTCESRDPKGLYLKARAGEIPNFTGISDPYEPPEMPELRLAGDTKSVDALAQQVVEFLRSIGKVSP
jgi:adenylylsulfate kinase